MSIRIRNSLVGLSCLVALAFAVSVSVNTGAQEPRPADEKPTAQKAGALAVEPNETDPAVERTRKTVRMLDDLYKTTVVLITKTYVEDETSPPAISAAIALWETMENNGWHKARLVDATGDPYDSDNIAKSEFEKQAIKRLTAEQTYLDTVVTEDGKRYLEAVTQVPVVMEKCKLCHPSYHDLAPGTTIGAISYRVPIDE